MENKPEKLVKRIPIMYLEEILPGTPIDGDNPSIISQIMVDHGKAYWVTILNR